MKHRHMFVYLSGPMTARDIYSIEDNVAAGVRVYLELLRRGVPCFSPHLAGAFPSAWSTVPYDTWLDYDLAVIERCTHVIMLPRWRGSKGACIEYNHAIRRNLPVLEWEFITDEWPLDTSKTIR